MAAASSGPLSAPGERRAQPQARRAGAGAGARRPAAAKQAWRPWALAALAASGLALLAFWPEVGGVAPLPWATAAATAASLAAIGTPVTWQGDLLHHAGGFVAQVHRDCTVLWPACALLGGLALVAHRRAVAAVRRPTQERVCGPTSARVPALVPAMALGVLFMAMVNQARLVGVIWLAVHAPGHYPWVHEGLAPLLLALALLAWVAAFMKMTAEEAEHASSSVLLPSAKALARAAAPDRAGDGDACVGSAAGAAAAGAGGVAGPTRASRER